MDDKTVQELIQRRIQQIENPPPNEHLNKFLQDLKLTQKLFNCKIIRLADSIFDFYYGSLAKMVKHTPNEELCHREYHHCVQICMQECS